MRLRYFRLQNLRPLMDVAITFQREVTVEQLLAVHFVVGVNGTGKTRLLEALTETFIAMEYGQARLPFPVTLAYDRMLEDESRTIYFQAAYGETSAVLAVFQQLPDDTDWAALADRVRADDASLQPALISRFIDEIPGSFSPNPLLVYTSGHTAAWEALFAPRSSSRDFTATEVLPDNERPLDWTVLREREQLRQTSVSDEEVERLQEFSLPELSSRATTPSTSSFLTTDDLKLAVAVVTLDHARSEWQSSDEHDDNLSALLKEVDWRWPLTLTLSVDLQPDRWSQPDAERLYRLIWLANAVSREPEPGTGRRLVFDLNLARAATVNEVLYILGGEQPTPYEVFRTLQKWRTLGLLRDLTLTLRKHTTADRDVLLFDSLSDGERMFLGRIALFYLLKGQEDALLILDEPENHFNDYWKHKLVDIIVDALRQHHSEVLISTHSSIALTDVFADEIVLLKKADGETIVVPVPIPTFGADPSEIMIRLFDAPDSIGKRALEYLEEQLKIEWRPEQRAELDRLIRKIGAGYYRAELRTAWKNLHAA
jgi:predicted ATPase